LRLVSQALKSGYKTTNPPDDVILSFLTAGRFFVIALLDHFQLQASPTGQKCE
jgi:hypothetical protein